MMQIRDPIHGYITLDGMYAEIVNTPEFQRLRAIEQGSFRPVFPGARHDRFLHSLGTYYLAVKFADHFFRNLKEDLDIQTEEETKLKTTFCYAALLHDIGHAPFSHTTEDFFTEPKDPARPRIPQIWTDLCAAVGAADPREGDLFTASPKAVGAAHEIASSLLLVRNRDLLTKHEDRLNVDLPLAARMVIGFPYQPGDLGMTKEEQGIRNCLIRLLNADIMDVDRLDYLGRDTQMSGYVNAPLDLDCLAASVTAVRMADGQLAPAFRDVALRVFDLMFQAKLSHDVWVLASPAGPYDAALKAHCIRKFYGSDMEKIFSVESLSRTGREVNGKTYRLLSDVDVEADLKSRTDGAFGELHTRALGVRRTAAWRSYYEYHHIFNTPGVVTPDSVYNFFQPLLKYMQKEHLFEFNQAAFDQIRKSGTPEAVRAAEFLREYLMHLPEEAEKAEQYNVVLLDKSIHFTIKKLNPEKIYITFPQRNIPTRADGREYSTYAELTGVIPTGSPEASNPYARSFDYFYLYRHGGLGHKQLTALRDRLAEVL